MAILLARYEALRTTFPAGEPPVQRVARTGELVIDVYEAGGEATDSAVLAVPLIRLLRSTEFDLAAGLPMRMAIAARHGEPLAAVVVYSHMAVDFASMALIDREFTALVSDPGHREPGPPAHQPFDQAADERSERGARRNEAALRSWEAQLRAMPQCMFAVPADATGPAGAGSGWLWSRAAALALPHVAARTGVSRQVVVFAALCTMLAWRTGHTGCVLPVASTNRYRRHLRGYVGPLAQDCTISVDTQAGGLDEVVRRTAAAAVRGYRNGLVDITALKAVFARVERDRGIIYARHCVFNDLSVHLGDTDDGAAPGRDPADAKLALTRTRFAALAAPPIEEILMFLLQQVSEELILGGLTRDASLLPAGEIELLLRGTESLVVAAASGDVDLDKLAEITGVRPVERGADWQRIDRSWVSLDAIRRLLADALPAPAAAFAVPERDDLTLVAYLAATAGVASPAQAHEACMKVLREPDSAGRGRHTAIAPGRYVICAGPPANPDDRASWQRQPVIASGDGRPH
jgi:Condensation domain